MAGMQWNLQNDVLQRLCGICAYVVSQTANHQVNYWQFLQRVVFTWAWT